MTNKEKAKEIGTAIWEEWKDSALAVGAEDGASLMAEWKDQQFKKYLEKKKEGLFNSNCLSVEPYIDFIDEIINELFLESKETDNSNNDE